MRKPVRLTWMLAVLVLLASGPAGASSITIYDSTLQPWTVSWNDYRVTVLDLTDGQNPLNPVQTAAVTKVVNFDALLGTAPVVITFTEDNVSTQNIGGNGNPGGGAGLNFVLTNVIFNDTANTWLAFDERLTDRDLFEQGALLSPAPPPNTGSVAHPAIAHFHPPPGGFANAINPNPAPWVVVGNPNATNDMYLAKFPNVMPNGGAELDFAVRIHDILAVDYQRRFDLTETPTPMPEPVTLTLVSGGVVALLACRRRKRVTTGRT